MKKSSKSYVVYVHRNKVDGKVYVGITSSSVNRRWQNGWGYASQPLFWNAIQKYGWENFDHEVVGEGLSEDAACRLEIELISLYQSNDRRFGYNRDAGGFAPGRVSEQTKTVLREKNLGKTLSAETKRKLSLSHTGKHLSDETKQKLRESSTGRVVGERTRELHRQRMLGNTIWLGRKLSPVTIEKIRQKAVGREFSEEWCRHISEAKKGKNTGADNATSRSVMCLETGVIYDTVTAAASAVHGSRSRIRASCLDNRRTSGGYHWKYVEEFERSGDPGASTLPSV